jgi:hypothetical protein
VHRSVALEIGADPQAVPAANIYHDRFDRFDARVSEFEDLIEALDAEDAAAAAFEPCSVANVVIEGVARSQAPRNARSDQSFSDAPAGARGK